MGAFILFDISFETLEDRIKFENKYSIKQRSILVGEKSNSLGFVAFHFNRDVYLEVIYNMGFMGYGEPKEILDECLKEGIKIKFMAWIPVNDRDSLWEKLRGRWSNGNQKSRQECSDCLLIKKNIKCKDKYCLVNKLLKEKNK